jgi:hypothetical protein
MNTCDRPRLRVLAACGALVTMLGARPAAAQAEDQAAARALFNDARDLMKAGQYEQACPKLEAANKLYPGSGVLLNLGDCYEHLGKTASAWTEFGEAAFAADRAGRPVDKAEALRRQGILEPKLSRLVIRVAKEAPGLVVKRDGSAIERGAWGAAVPVDPGKHEVSAEAGGFLPWSGTVTVAEPGQTAALDVPELQPAPQPPPPPPTVAAPPAARPEVAPPRYWTARRSASVAVAGVGLVGMGVGGLVGLVAKSKFDSALGETGEQRHTDSLAAVRTSDAATVVVSVGAVFLVGGLVFWLTAPDAPVQVGASGQGVLVHGSFR